MADSIKDAVSEAVETLSEKEATVETSVTEESVREGAEEQSTEEGTDEKESSEETEETPLPDEEGKASEEESGKSEEPDARTAAGHKLYDALTGADGPAALEQLAKQFGRKLAPADQTPPAESGVEEKADKITAIFDKHLGEGYEFLSERMGKAIKEVLTNEVDPRFAQQQQKSDTKVMQETLLSHISKDKISEKDKNMIIANANKLLKRMPPQYNNNQNELIEYVGDIYMIASQGVKKSQDAARNATRITKNLQDEDAPSVNAATPKVRKRPSNSKQSGMAGIKDAVKAAFEGVRLED